MSEAKDRVKAGLVYLQYAVEEARAVGEPKFAIMAKLPDDTWKMLASFDCEKFIADLMELSGAEPLTEKERIKAQAAAFLDRHGLSVERNDDTA